MLLNDMVCIYAKSSYTDKLDGLMDGQMNRQTTHGYVVVMNYVKEIHFQRWAIWKMISMIYQHYK